MEDKKNIQVIDGAQNSSYSIYKANISDFTKIFPASGQDIEFIKDFIKRVGEKKANEILKRLWASPVDKKKVRGIHGTLFYELEYKKKFYPTKRESEMITEFEPKYHINNKK